MESISAARYEGRHGVPDVVEPEAPHPDEVCGLCGADEHATIARVASHLKDGFTFPRLIWVCSRCTALYRDDRDADLAERVRPLVTDWPDPVDIVALFRRNLIELTEV